MLAEQYDVFLIDLDGVVYLGDQLLPGSKKAIKELRRRGKKLYFLTNDPRFLRQELCGKLARLGLAVSPEECITSGWATAHYLVEQLIDRVYVIGTESLKTEIRNQGITVMEQGACQAVIVGYCENTTFYQVQQAVRQFEQGAQFIATNPDCSFPGIQGRCVATGSIVQAVQAACGLKPVIIGKPYEPMFRMALKQQLDNRRAVMIGDSPPIDILGAHQYGIDAILVEQKASSQPVFSAQQHPDATIKNLLELFHRNDNVTNWRFSGVSWPDSVEPGVAAVIFNERGHVLLVRRTDNGLWGLPSGHVEVAETVTQAVCREIYEETGLTAEVVKLLGVYSDPATQVFSYPSGKTTHFITLSFLCRIEGGRLQPDYHEICEAGFFAIEQLPKDLMLMHPRWLADALTGTDLANIR